MNSYYNQRNMSHKGTRKQAMSAPKLMAIENEYHRTKDALVHEIKRLRGEVGVLAKRYNNAKREIEDLVKRVRSQPPPPVPRRDEETERKIEERREKFRQHLQRETEAEKEKEEEKEKDIVMLTVNEVEQIEEENLSPEQSPLDQRPQSEVESIAPRVPSLVSTPPASDTDEDVAMEEKPAKRVTIQAIYTEDGWLERMKKLSTKQMMKEFEGKRKRWAESCEMMKIGEDEMGLEGDLDEISNRMLQIIDQWTELKRKGKFRGWGNPELADGMLYAQKKLEWKVTNTVDGMEFEEW